MKVSKRVAKPKKTVGIEIAKSGLRAVAIKYSGHQPEVFGTFVIENLEEDWWESENRADVHTQLAEFVKTHRLKGCPTILSMPNEKVILRYITMPQLPPKALRSAIEVDLGTTIHLPFEDPVFDVVPVPALNPSTLNPDQGAYCLVAAPKELVDFFTDMVKTAKLRPMAVDVAPLALWRLQGLTADDGTLSVLAQIDQFELTLSLFVGDNMYFFRSNSVNIPSEPDEYAVESCVTDIVYEFERVVSFFNYSLSAVERSVERFVVHSVLNSGEHIRELLSSRLNRDIELIKADVSWKDHQDVRNPGMLFCAVGLALKEDVRV